MAELVFFRRGEEVLRFALDGSRVVLGRGEQCDVVLPDPDISRQHVAVSLDGGVWRLEDLSGKGALVGGKSVSEARLEDGVDVALGRWRAVFRAQSAGDTAAVTEVGQATEVAPGPDGDAVRQPAQVRIRHDGKDTVHRLQSEGFTVGKDAANDLVLEHRFISSRHVKVTRQGPAFHVVDQHSTNGTWLGPVRVFEAEVPFFTALKLGETELVLEPWGTGLKSGGAYQGLIGNDPSVRALTELVERVAPSQAAVAVLGESGTGKELVARALHSRSTRADKPFIPVNCAAISKELIESELFGHEKGAFTGAMNARRGAFEEADGGTLFLDEIGELPLELQAKLLRALESGEIKRVGASRPQTVDVRIIAATNRDLLNDAREGRFREDLYYRLCVVPLHLPPLRSRKGDIQTLAEHFIAMFSPRGQNVRLSATALGRLQAWTWPGNVRELKNVIHRALLLRKGTNIEADDLSFDAARPEAALTKSSALEYVPGTSLEQMLEHAERSIVVSALRQFGNNRERVAKELKVARSTLFKRLKDWGLTNPGDANLPE